MFIVAVFYDGSRRCIVGHIFIEDTRNKAKGAGSCKHILEGLQWIFEQSYSEDDEDLGGFKLDYLPWNIQSCVWGVCSLNLNCCKELSDQGARSEDTVHLGVWRFSSIILPLCTNNHSVLLKPDDGRLSHLSTCQRVQSQAANPTSQLTKDGCITAFRSRSSGASCRVHLLSYSLKNIKLKVFFSETNKYM